MCARSSCLTSAPDLLNALVAKIRLLTLQYLVKSLPTRVESDTAALGHIVYPCMAHDLIAYPQCALFYCWGFIFWFEWTVCLGLIPSISHCNPDPIPDKSLVFISRFSCCNYIFHNGKLITRLFLKKIKRENVLFLFTWSPGNLKGPKDDILLNMWLMEYSKYSVGMNMFGS